MDLLAFLSIKKEFWIMQTQIVLAKQQAEPPRRCVNFPQFSGLPASTGGSSKVKSGYVAA